MMSKLKLSDFSDFKEMLAKATDYILNEKGSEVISERHQKDYKKEEDLEYQEYLRECEELRTNHVNPIHYDENGEEVPF